MSENNGALLSTIPLSETLALSRAPIKWVLQLEGHEVRMAVPLFSYTQYNYYKRFSALVRARDASGSILPLPIWLAAAKGESESAKLARDGLADALEHYRETHGCTPDTLNDLLAMLTEPTDPDDFWSAVEAWSERTGMGYYRPTSPDSDATRDALRTVIGHCLPVSDMLVLLEDLGKVNVEVKKKFLADLKGPQEEKSPSRNLSSILDRIRLGEIRASS